MTALWQCCIAVSGLTERWRVFVVFFAFLACRLGLEYPPVSCVWYCNSKLWHLAWNFHNEQVMLNEAICLSLRPNTWSQGHTLEAEVKAKTLASRPRLEGWGQYHQSGLEALTAVHYVISMCELWLCIDELFCYMYFHLALHWGFFWYHCCLFANYMLFTVCNVAVGWL